MLYQFLGLFIVLHFITWLLGVVTKRGGFILVAVTILFFTMALPIIVLEYPLEVTANNTTQLQIVPMRDPVLTMVQFPLLFWYVWSYYEIIGWGKDIERGGF